MKTRKIIGGIGVVLMIFLVLLLLDMEGYLSPPTLSAKEGFEKASEILENQGRKAVFTEISVIRIPAKISGPITIQDGTGRGESWNICFYSKEKNEYIYFENITRERLREEDYHARTMCSRHENGINIEKWKIDSEEAVEIAKEKIEELGKEGLVCAGMQLFQEENRPIWIVEFTSEHVGATLLLVRLDAETGKVIKVDETPLRYKPVD
jgi:hypothetical protein